jgi:hypothetical protein
MSLRVVVRAGPALRRPYSWVIIDYVTGKEFQESGNGFRTFRLAWEAGIAALDQFRARHQGAASPEGQTSKLGVSGNEHT